MGLRAYNGESSEEEDANLNGTWGYIKVLGVENNTLI